MLRGRPMPEGEESNFFHEVRPETEIGLDGPARTNAQGHRGRRWNAPPGDGNHLATSSFVTPSVSRSQPFDDAISITKRYRTSARSMRSKASLIWSMRIISQ